jgi:hypothetical protein
MNRKLLGEAQTHEGKHGIDPLALEAGVFDGGLARPHLEPEVVGPFVVAARERRLADADDTGLVPQG